MDAHGFDTLARSLSAEGTRRGLVRLVLGLPLAAGVVARFEEPSRAIDDDHGSSHRRYRRHVRNRRRSGRRQTPDKGKDKDTGKGMKRTPPPPPPPGCAGATLCPSGQCCDGGQCVASCPAPGFCGGGGTAGVCGAPPQGTCPDGADYCATGNPAFLDCNSTGNCLCVQTIEGATVCVGNVAPTCDPCPSSTACGPDQVCVVDTGASCTCFGSPSFCVELC